MIRFALPLLACAVGTVSAGCSPADGSGDAGAVSLEPPEACRLVEPSPSASYPPASAWGTEVGAVAHDLTFDDCDGEPVRFSDIVGQSELVLFNIGAGWCEPCIEETETLDAEIFRRFCDRGLRVIQVLYQDEDSNPATKLFCRDWRQQYGLSFPVVVDPLFESGVYFEDITSQTPLNLLVDREGVIRYQRTGVTPADLAERIDALLPSE